jgi:2,4-dienoyl-CoA reductase-like NADH-dependent reductase (Old Yellow Enzyme family)/thioredoxin reductase
VSLITSLVKRRQFLLGAVGSTCALSCKKLAAFAVANGAAATGSPAAEAQAASAAAAGAAGNRCPHLLSPLRIRNVILKNRIMHTVSTPHSIQGPENYPSDAYRNHYSNIAKNAGIVSLESHWGTFPINYSAGGGSSETPGPSHFSDHSWEDIPPVHNYINRMIDDIHIEGALINYAGTVGGGGGGESGGGGGAPGGGGGAPGGGAPQGAAGGPGGAPQGAAGAQGGMPGGAGGPGGGAPDGAAGAQAGGAGAAGGRTGTRRAGGQGGGPGGQRQDTRTVEEIVTEAKGIEAQGYDVYGLNTTKPEAVEAVRNATNLVLLTKMGVGTMTGGGPGSNASNLHDWVYVGSNLDWPFGKNSPGLTNDNKPTKDELDKAVEDAKKLEGLTDILWLRDGRHEHPNSFTQSADRPFNLYYAEAIKKAGVKVLVAPSAGFHDSAQNEQFIAGGLADLVGMSTPFFADPQFIKKVSEGSLDDIIPCIQCHNCHCISRSEGPWYDTCTVSPQWATPAYKLQNIPAPTARKKVAVIGGGMAGMRAAMVASERGHKVTLYERDKVLGGHMQFTDYTQWKWTYKKFKDYLVSQVNKHGVEVLLNTKATPELIKAKDYDTVLVANGAQPTFSEWETGGAANVFNLMDAYTNKAALGKSVVMVGEGMYSTEAAIGLAKDGHKVMILAPSNELIEFKYIGSHNMMNQIQILENHPNLNFEVNTKVKSIKGNTVTYTDSKGAEKTIEADSFVIWSGMKPRVDDAEKFIDTADQVLFMGDCTGKAGTVQKTQRQAFFLASQV